MAFRDYLPFVQSKAYDSLSESLDPDKMKSLSKALKPRTLAIGYRGTILYYNTRSTFEPSPYDFDRIVQAIDTDSYAKQAMMKYKELFWKEGWSITSENQEAVSYLYERIDYMEIAMKRPFSDFLMEVCDQLIKFGNAFIVKARGDMSEYFPRPLYPIGNALPIIGYYIIPTEQVRILRDKHNKPKTYQQRTDPFTYTHTDIDPLWSADKVMHFFFDRKPGRAFGTPFIANAMDDIVALRQIEEDIQNLVHRELFPLYKYKIGTAEQPAEPEEIDKAAVEIESMRAEGGLILPYRHDVEVIGAQGTALDIQSYLNHFKERVAIGLGVAPHHLGMSMNGGNRSMTDRLDTALYDKVKHFQKQFAELVRLFIFNELLFEGGYDPITNPSDIVITHADRCYFTFNEIDVDTKVKRETHVIQQYTASMISLPEARIMLGLDPEYQKEELFPGIQTSIQAELGPATQAKGNPADQDPKTQDAASDKQQKSTKGKVNLPNRRKGPGNILRPANQVGKRMSPNIRRSDSSWLSVIENALEKEYTVIEQDPSSEPDVDPIQEIANNED